MLLKYRSDYEKITMGLLSFVKTLKRLNRLTAELAWYQASANRQLLLWKDANQDFSGVVGIELKPGFVVVRLLALTPAARNERHLNQMLDELADLYPSDKVIGLLTTTKLVAQWEAKHE